MTSCKFSRYLFNLSCAYPAFRRRDFTSHLVYRMCEDHAVDRLMALNFAGLSDEVEEALSFKARNADPRIRPFYSRILYTWYISRGDYRNGECAMRSNLYTRQLGTKYMWITSRSNYVPTSKEIGCPEKEETRTVHRTCGATVGSVRCWHQRIVTG